MIDPIHSLAFSIQASRGVYAVLVGSGVSSGAKIPTGWEVTLDLIRKLARLHREECDPDPEGWYRGKFNKEADYSEILDNLAKTPAERQQLLRGYWEPNSSERENGDKQPTAAHRAIASLSANGFVRVILTTNFDRLVEIALRDQFSDLVDGAVERVVEVTSGEEFAVQGGPTPDRESVTARVRRYEAACSTLLAMATVGGFWAEEGHCMVWERALQRLGSTTLSGGYPVWPGLRRYPATLLFYALGLGALAADRLRFVGRVFAASLHDEDSGQVPAVSVLPASCGQTEGRWDFWRVWRDTTSL